MSACAWPHRLALVVIAVTGLVLVGTGCATKGFVRQETQKTATVLSARIDQNEKAIEETGEQVRSANSQISELSTLNKQNAQKIDSLSSEVQRVDGRAGQARSAADGAQQTADKANRQVTVLDERFANRNRMGMLLERTVYFQLGSARLESSYHQDLIEAARVAKENANAVVAVEGRTDESGDAPYNIRLGENRVEAVVRFLVVDQGVPMHKVYKMSFGEDQPLASNETREGRAKNRCAVVKVLAPEAPGT